MISSEQSVLSEQIESGVSDLVADQQQASSLSIPTSKPSAFDAVPHNSPYDVGSHIPAHVISHVTSHSPSQGIEPVHTQNREGLEKAFQLFGEMSEQLAESYQILEQRVSDLTGELDEVSAQRLEELSEKERLANRLQSLLEVLPGGVIVLDARGRVQECNPTATDLLGNRLIGERWIDIIQSSFAPRSDDGHEVSLKDGRRVSIATRSMVSESAQIVLLTDQTETRELQEQLSRHERLSSMGRMVASLAHQVRTPLSAAMLYAGHLTKGELPNDMVQKFSKKLMSRLTHMEQQVRDMLVFASGKFEIRETIPLSVLIQKLEQAFDAPVASSSSSCDVITSAIDPSRLEQNINCHSDVLVGALLNLVNNAIQAVGRNARIEIFIKDISDESIVLCIKDYGPGFDEATKAKLMEPFFTTKTHGTGLGLSVVQAVIRAHHGEFSIESTPGEGTEATIVLPVVANVVPHASVQNNLTENFSDSAEFSL